MLRRFIFAIATVAALGISFDATSSSAAPHGHAGGHGHGGGHGGGYHGGYRGGGGWGGGGWGFFGFPYAYAPGPYYPAGCYRMIRVRTPYGPRWRRVWVCD